MKFTFLFLNLVKIHIFIPKCSETRVVRVTRVTTLARMTMVTRVTRVTKAPIRRYPPSYLECLRHQDFQNIAYVGCFRYFVCVFVVFVIFVIVFVFVFVFSYGF